jgi:hypothetical protein
MQHVLAHAASSSISPCSDAVHRDQLLLLLPQLNPSMSPQHFDQLMDQMFAGFKVGGDMGIMTCIQVLVLHVFVAAALKVEFILTTMMMVVVMVTIMALLLLLMMMMAMLLLTAIMTIIITSKPEHDHALNEIYRC